MKKFHLCLIVMFVVLTGCNEVKVTEETRTVEFYKQNKQARTEKLKECKNNPGELADTPNCKNAKEAALLSMKGDPNNFRF